MNELIFYAILLGLICIAGAANAYYMEKTPNLHRKNRSFGEMLRTRKARMETKKLADARNFVREARESGLIKG